MDIGPYRPLSTPIGPYRPQYTGADLLTGGFINSRWGLMICPYLCMLRQNNTRSKATESVCSRQCA